MKLIKSLFLLLIIGVFVRGVTPICILAEETSPSPEEPSTITQSSTGSISFKPSESIVPPVDPEDPGTTVKPGEEEGEEEEEDKPTGTKGPLSIDFVSSFDFGENEITSKNMDYYAAPQKVRITDGNKNTTIEERANYVQVSDFRGTNQGWTLQVKQNGQFKNEKDGVLDGAVILIDEIIAKSTSSKNVGKPEVHKIELNPGGNLHKVMVAEENHGMMTWLGVFGKLEEKEGVLKNTGVKLHVPGATLKDATKYSTSLTWTLSDVVANN